MSPAEPLSATLPTDRRDGDEALPSAAGGTDMHRFPGIDGVRGPSFTTPNRATFKQGGFGGIAGSIH